MRLGSLLHASKPNAQTETDRVNAPVSNVGLNKTEHLLGGLGHLDEHTIVDLEETKELENFAGLGRNVVDTDPRCQDLVRRR